jgi:hypothetical protein
MSMQPLNSEQITAYQRDGYLIVENLLLPGEIKAFVDYEKKGNTRPGRAACKTIKPIPNGSRSLNTRAL